MSKKKRYCVVYRTGGTENFKWNRTMMFIGDRSTAQAHCEDVKRMGYHAFVEDYDLSISNGLPETFEYSPKSLTPGP